MIAPKDKPMDAWREIAKGGAWAVLACAVLWFGGRPILTSHLEFVKSVSKSTEDNAAANRDNAAANRQNAETQKSQTTILERIDRRIAPRWEAPTVPEHTAAAP